MALILDGTFAEEAAVPSVRQVSAQYRINHLTVSEAYQGLVDEGLLEKRRGLGMFVTPGARQQLHSREQRQFLDQELPALLLRIKQLGLDTDEVIKIIQQLEDET